MSRYLAVVRRDPGGRRFVIRSPDFPEVEERCQEFERIPAVACEAIGRQLGKLEVEGRQPPRPTPKESLEARPEYRECFVVRVEADGAVRSRSGS